MSLIGNDDKTRFDIALDVWRGRFSFGLPTLICRRDGVEQYGAGDFFRDGCGQQIIHATGTFNVFECGFNLSVQLVGQSVRENETGLSIGGEQ